MIDPMARNQISNESEYQAALRELGPYFDGPEIDPESAQGKKFLALVTLVEEYEKKHYPIERQQPEMQERELEAVRAGKSKAVPLEEVMKQYGLAG